MSTRSKAVVMSILRVHSRNRWVVRTAFFAAAAILGACSGDGPSDPGQLAAQYGSLQVTISGLPSGAQAGVTVTGPGGFSRSVTATTTLTQLSAGQYTVTVADVTHDGSTYSGAPSSQSYTVAAGASVTSPTVSYALATGTLSVTLAGLPQSSTAQIVVSGPDAFIRTLTSATNLVGLKPGQYSIEAREVQFSNARYAASPVTQVVDVSASLTPAVAHVAYALSTGTLQININGLPAGASALVTVSGPANYSRTLTEEAVLDNLTPGTYQIAAQHVVAGPLFTPAPTVQQVQVAASAEATVANVTYVSQGTSLSIQVVGLPGSVPAKATLTGPNGYSKQVSATEIISGLAAGTYTLSAQPVSASCATYSVTPVTQNIVVTAGQGAVATLNYSTGSIANLCIEGAYITQSVQTFDNSVPLVAGRAGLLRVFVKSSGSNSAQPPVRVRFYNSSGALVSTTTIQAPSATVPVSLDESALSASWNQTLTGSLLQPGLRLLLDVDPNNAVSEPNENDNTWPANGTPVALDIRPVSTMFLTIVPVVQAARGDTGRVDQTNKANFILPMQRMFPVANIEADVRAPYTFTGTELQSGGANWQTLLMELNALRVADANGRMYYGIVRVGYTSGVAGLGYIGVPASVGWDYQPSGTEVMAHELGHNFGRLHAPCGNPAGVDGQYPYSGADIGVYGYDILSGVPKAPALRDLMSYCNPPWISDYTYRGILDFRAQRYPPLGSATQAASTSQRGLLVWGRIEGGRLVLEPAIEVDAPASLPTRSGPHRVEGFGPNGETLFSFSFAGERVADTDSPNDQSFAFVVPMSQLRGVELNRVRLAALGRQVEQRGSGGGEAPAVQRTAPGRVRVTWNSSTARLAMIRDGRSGQILSFDRRGTVDLRTTSEDIEVTLSDGVKSTRARIRPK
jgi:hypothetical protein